MKLYLNTEDSLGDLGVRNGLNPSGSVFLNVIVEDLSVNHWDNLFGNKFKIIIKVIEEL